MLRFLYLEYYCGCWHRIISSNAEEAKSDTPSEGVSKGKTAGADRAQTVKQSESLSGWASDSIVAGQELLARWRTITIRY